METYDLITKRACVIARKMGIPLEKAKKLKKQAEDGFVKTVNEKIDLIEIERSFVSNTKTATINEPIKIEESDNGES